MTDALATVIVGATLRINVRVSTPTSPQNPVVPSRVYLSALAKADGTVVNRPSVVDFSGANNGEYRLNVPTAGFAPGVYRYQVTALAANSVVAIVEDTFVLSTGLVTLP